MNNSSLGYRLKTATLSKCENYRDVILSETQRSGVKSKDLRTYGYVCGQIGEKILRLAPLAQDDMALGLSYFNFRLSKVDSLNCCFYRKCSKNAGDCHAGVRTGSQ